MKNFFTRIGAAILCAFIAYGFAPNDNDPRGKNPDRDRTSSIINENRSPLPYSVSTPSDNMSILSGIIKENFDAVTFPPAGWSSVNVAGPTYTWARSTAQSHTAPASAFIRYDAAAGGGQDWLISPRFTVASTDSVVFWMRLAFAGYQPDSLSVKVSTTDSLVGSFTGTLLTLREGVNYPGNTTTWYRYSVPLGSFAGQNVFVAFKHFNVDGDGLYIDDVQIGTPYANDIAAQSINVSVPLTPKATFNNIGTATNSFPVTMTITPGGYSSTKTVTSLAPDASSEVTFDNWNPAAGTYTITAIAQLGTDGDRSNDTIRTTTTIYAPFSNNGWSSQVALAAPRWAHGMAFYNSGTYPNDTGFVYLISGADGAFANTTLVTRLNTVTGIWDNMAPIPQSRTQVNAVTIGSRIYVPGGYGGSFSPVNTLSIYNIPTDTWTTGAVMPQAVGDYAIGAYGDSLIYVIGGYTGSGDVNLVQIYNVNTDTWSSGTPKIGGASAGLRGGIVGNKIIVAGGYSQTLAATLKTSTVGTIDPSNPNNITWVAGPDYPSTSGRLGAGPLVVRRNGGNSTRNYVLFSGGDPNGQGTSVMNSTYAFDFSDNTWKIGPNKPTGVSNIMQMVSFEKGDSLYMMNGGGYTGTIVTDANEIINMGPVPRMASLLVPANTAAGVQLASSLDWSDAVNASSYRVQISSNPGFSSLIKDTIVTASTMGLQSSGLSYLTQYYWRVQSIGAVANSGFTSAFSFTTVLSPPAAPSLVSPSNGAIGQQLSLSLRWTKPLTSATYHVQLATDSAFTSIIVNDSTLTDSIKAVTSLNPLTRYYWRVRAKNAGGNSAFSSIYNFKTLGTPFSVGLVSPTNNATNVPVNVNFLWFRTIDQTRPTLKTGSIQSDNSVIGSYWFELTTDTVAMSNLVVDSTLTDTTKTVNGLNNITDYFWRVRAKNEIGYSSFSTWNKFTTIVPNPAVPVLVSPSNGATGQSLTTDLKWNPVQYATNYRVQVATDAAFTTIVLNDSTVTDTIKTVSGLNTFTQYFWRVQSKNIGGISAFSSAFNFVTIVSAPAAPVLVAPLNNATGVSLTPQFNWDSVTFATSFRIIVASDTAFNNTVIDTAGLTVSEFLAPSGVLSNGIKYYWKVNATSAAGAGNFSAPFNFTTAILPPVAPVLVFPLNNSIGQSATPLLDWDSLGAAQTYRVQLSNDSTFATTIIDADGLTNASYQVASGLLFNNVKYFWRVNATNTAGTGSYSDVWNFRTLGVGINPIAGAIPTEFKLYNNYPNPFNPVTKIRFDIPKASFVSLKVYDITGREIAKLVDGNLAPSSYEVLWNAANSPSGVYFYRIQTNDNVNTMRMVLVK